MLPHPNDNEDFLIRLREIIETHLNDDRFGVNELAREMGMSRSNLHRKLKSHTGKSISRFIGSIRLGKALELLRKTDSTISEIAFETGFSSVTYFSKCFRDYYGIPPSEVRKRLPENAEPEDLQRKEPVSVARKKKTSTVYMVAAMILLMVSIGLRIISRLDEKGGEPFERSVAVLPFNHDTNDPSEIYFIDRTMETILSHLDNMAEFSVAPLPSVERYRNNPKPLQNVGEEMKVRYLVAGNVVRQGDRIRLTVWLHDVVHNQRLWSDTYARDADEIARLPGEVARQVADDVEAFFSRERKRVL